jgi:predicted RNase H-like HicB family nuclease
MINIEHYTYKTIWSEQDQEFVGLCEEFPGLSHLDPDRQAAFTGIIDLVKFVVADMQANGEPLPVPIVDRKPQSV